MVLEGLARPWKESEEKRQTLSHTWKYSPPVYSYLSMDKKIRKNDAISKPQIQGQSQVINLAGSEQTHRDIWIVERKAQKLYLLFY